MIADFLRKCCSFVPASDHFCSFWGMEVCPKTGVVLLYAFSWSSWDEMSFKEGFLEQWEQFRGNLGSHMTWGLGPAGISAGICPPRTTDRHL